MPPQADQSQPSRPPPPPGYFDADAQSSRPAPPAGYYDADATAPDAAPEKESRGILSTIMHGPSDALAAVGSWAGQKEQKYEEKKLADAAHGKHQGPFNIAPTAEFGLGALRDTANMASGIVSPGNAAALGATALVPEVGLPYFAYKGAKSALTPKQEGETTPDEVQRRLMGGAQAVGSVAGAGASPTTASERIGRVAPAIKSTLNRFETADKIAIPGTAGTVKFRIRQPPPPPPVDPLDAAVKEGRAAKLPVRMPAAGKSVDPLVQAVREGRAAKLPTRMPRPAEAEPPLPGIPGATQSDAVGQTATPGSLNAITPAPGDMTSTGGAPVQFSGPAVAPPKTPKIPGQVMRVPEPTGGDPRWMASVPRGKLPGLAAQGREGAAEQLQNIGKTVLIEPRGGDISNVRERTTFGTEGQVAETNAIPASERTQTPGATKRNAFGEIIKEDAPGKSAPTFKTVAPEAPKQLTEEESRDTRAQIADLRRQARGFAAKQETARVRTKANEYMRREKALLDKADLLEKNLGLGKTARPALTGSTKEELHATYNSASPEIKTEVDRLAEEYKTLESFEKSHFEHDYGLDRSTGGWTGLPIKERLARVLSRAPAANPDDEPPF